VEHVAIPERRTRQFEHYLDLMRHRTLRLVRSDCFLGFSVPAPRRIRRRIGGSTTRIVQFAFTANGFYIDIPDTSMTPEEARRAVAERPRFGFALDNRLKTLGERQYDPVQRHYHYGEGRAAAEDAAYVFFNLWQIPVDASIKVRAAAFEVKRHWERGFSMR